jgi:hypothetical protein
MNEQPNDQQDVTAETPDAPQDAGAADTLQKERDDLYDRLLRKTASAIART